jgi:hypothetical protein
MCSTIQWAVVTQCKGSQKGEIFSEYIRSNARARTRSSPRFLSLNLLGNDPCFWTRCRKLLSAAHYCWGEDWRTGTSMISAQHPGQAVQFLGVGDLTSSHQPYRRAADSSAIRVHGLRPSWIGQSMHAIYRPSRTLAYRAIEEGDPGRTAPLSFQ